MARSAPVPSQPSRPAHRTFGGPRRTAAAAAAGLAGLIFLGAACFEREGKPPVPSGAGHRAWFPVAGAAYVGDAACRACHEAAYQEWARSDHYQAMLPASESTVLGDFDDAVFEHFGQVWRFFRKGDEFWFHAPGADGEGRDFQIAYTFGHDPLQQYLVAFPGGAYQALQVCWDSRPQEEGGQRWFHLYPDEPVPPEDPLHWTRREFNWNHMCAACHSTGLEKGFEPATRTYRTAWSSVNVSCEACHGPGSRHLEWAAADGGSEALNKGLIVDLAEPVAASWTIHPQTGEPYRSAPLASRVQLETCAPCHSHRRALVAGPAPGQPYLDTHLPSVLREDLYHHDGQIREEVFVYGSFVQSRMHQAGVRCTDCHHHHTQELLAEGNELCNRCHLAERYDDPAHHFHPAGSPGATCVECHMPHVTYMGVDERRDHSLRVPRPDLSLALGTPNACNRCHADETTEWAAAHFFAWWGDAPRATHYGEILAAARRNEPGSAADLAALAGDPTRPGIVRATALHELARMPLERAPLEPAGAGLEDPDPLVRHHAVALMELFPPEQRVALAAKALRDPARAVRVEAARVLAPAVARMGATDLAAFRRAAQEFEAQQAAGADRAWGPLGLGRFHQELGRALDAETAWSRAVELEPDHAPSRVTLAQWLHAQDRFPEAEAALLAALRFASTDEGRGVAHQALALAYVREARHEDGLTHLMEAARCLPGDARTQYLLGVALHSMERTELALGHLSRARELEPRNAEYLLGLATIARDAGLYEEAWSAARELTRLHPDDTRFQGLLEQIRRLRR